MFDFSGFLNLPLIFAFVIALAIFLYVLLDGFDLGVGILFPFAPTNDCRSKMMNSIAPFWDGNETWLVMGGGGLFAAFPLAYSILMPAFYIPIILMLLGLIFRGVAFEFRFKTESAKEQKIWDYAFYLGSIIAAFFQGVMLGAFVQGVKVENKIYAGGAFDWFNSFSVVCGIAVICGYALLGATWLIMKTDKKTQDWARKAAFYILILVAIFAVIISAWTPFLHEKIWIFWFSKPNFFYLLPVPCTAFLVMIFLFKTLSKKREASPFLLTMLLFLLCYFGLGISLLPYGVPYELKFEELAAASTSLSFLLVGVVVILPIILAYTAYSYRVFRGKSSHEKLY
jgi:cytochrome bd ubiquinol oxidase subunit II